MMAPDKLERIRSDIEKLRGKGGVRPAELEGLAKSLGRTGKKRGKEPTWVNMSHPDWRPLSIPHHAKELNKFTARKIINQLEEDVERLEEARDNRQEED